MATDFWEAQRKARSRTALLVVLFVILTGIMACLIEFAMRYLDSGYSKTQIPWMGAVFTTIAFSVAALQYIAFRFNGGSYVAESLGGYKVESSPRNSNEKQLLHIIEEMALAASLPIPSIYILPANQINAFAAGLTSQDAAITVTEGALNRLNRDELQGVIAHEFGHIHNGDIKISMRLAAMVMGFFFILYIGLRLMQFASFKKHKTANGRGGNPILMVALLFIAAGALTWFFGSILKSAVSREREYLADASAVQFTRNPNGIANALRKIAEEQTKDMPAQGAPYSHLYFNDLSPFSFLFHTHPPIKKRIEALLGKKYIPKEWNID